MTLKQILLADPDTGLQKEEQNVRWCEMFGPTIQGEGYYSGAPTIWLRSWNCNLKCPAFSQPDPRDKSTWDIAPDEFDPKEAGVTDVNELPVFSRGCDSRHTHDPRYKYLTKNEPASVVADQIIERLKDDHHNPEGLFTNPAGQNFHFAWTGGESMMAQREIVAVVRSFIDRGNYPKFITIETNATQTLKPEFKNFVKYTEDAYGIEWMFSMSPKLYTVSGNEPAKAHRPDVVRQYAELGTKAYLKFVVRGEQRVWDELDSVLSDYREAGVFEFITNDDIHVMPVGSSLEGQELTMRDVADEAVARGYRIAMRLHVFLYGNAHCM